LGRAFIQVQSLALYVKLSMMNLETVTKRLKIISDLQEELNRIRALRDESLENDPQYQQFQEETTKIREESKVKKDKILSTPTVKPMLDDIKKLRDEINENKEILAQELIDYYKESGSMEIVDQDGNTKRMKFSVRLVSQ